MGLRKARTSVLLGGHKLKIVLGILFLIFSTIYGRDCNNQVADFLLSFQENKMHNKRMTSHPERARRQSDAQKRQAAYDALSNEEKVDRAGLKQLHKMVKSGGTLGTLASQRLDSM